MAADSFDQTASDRLGVGASGRRVNLVRLAASQRVLIWAILAQLVMVTVYLGAAATMGTGVLPGWAGAVLVPLAWLAYVGVLILCLVLVVRMARAYGYNWFMSIAGGVLSLMSCIGLLFLVLLNQRVISTLKAAGVKVGFMGVDPHEMLKLREGVCSNCGYDIRGLTGSVCPECGGVVGRAGAGV